MLDEFWKSRDLKPENSLAPLNAFFGLQPDGKETKPVNKPEKRKWRKDEFFASPLLANGEQTKVRPKVTDVRAKSTCQLGSAYGVPFYGNVLLLAFEKNLLAGRPDSWMELASVVKRRGEFDCDVKSKETMACLLLDALIAAARQSGRLKKAWENARSDPNGTDEWLQEDDDAVGWQVRYSLLVKVKDDRRLMEKFVENMLHLGYLLNKRSEAKAVQTARRDDILAHKSKVFVCWYSQLRQLILNHEDLASRLKILALPGGGVRGDWYLAVAKGSVSLDLGVRAIDLLTGRQQEYDRFARGVGLPVRKNFRDLKFFAWPHSEATKADEVFKIHRAAYSRASIPGYTKFRRMLSIMVEEVSLAVKEATRGTSNGALSRDSDEPRLRREIQGILERIPAQLELLVGESS